MGLQLRLASIGGAASRMLADEWSISCVDVRMLLQLGEASEDLATTFELASKGRAGAGRR